MPHDVAKYFDVKKMSPGWSNDSVLITSVSIPYRPLMEPITCYVSTTSVFTNLPSQVASVLLRFAKVWFAMQAVPRRIIERVEKTNSIDPDPRGNALKSDVIVECPEIRHEFEDKVTGRSLNDVERRSEDGYLARSPSDAKNKSNSSSF